MKKEMVDIMQGTRFIAPKRVLFLRSNPIAPDPRVEKEATSLTKNGFLVMMVGWDRENKYPVHEQKIFGEVYRLKIKAGFAKGIKNIGHLFKWQIGLLLFLVKMRSNYDYIHACDFDTIFPALICKILFGKRVVYDIFDFYSDMLRKAPIFLRRAIKKVDLHLIGIADVVIIADEIRIEQIKGARPKKLVVIYNSPTVDQLGETESIDEHDKFTIAYVGLIQRERGIFEMIEVVKNHPEWKLILGGYGAEEGEVIEKIKSFDNIEFLGRIPYEQALQIYKSCDVMFATYDPSIPNHRYSSANKLFEAMMLGKPIIVAKNTGMDRIVEKYHLGFVVEYGNKKELEEAVTTVSKWDKSIKDEFSMNTRRVYEDHFSWEIMENRLINLYKELLEK